MRRILPYITLAFGLLLVTAPMQGQTFVSPRSLAFAQTYATQSRGSDALGWNPANLGYSDNPGFSMSYGLFPLVPLPTIHLGNSSVSIAWYNDYFRQGGVLTKSMKDEILSYFPTKGWSFDPQITTRLLGMSFGHTAIALDAQVMSSVVIPKSVPHLLFYGMGFDDPLSLDNLHVGLQTTLTASVAHAFRLPLPFFEESYLGVGAKYIAGLGYAATESVTGGITPYPDRMVAEGNAMARYALSGFIPEVDSLFSDQPATPRSALAGSGYAFDIGLSGRLNNKLSMGVAINNLLGAINWKGTNSETYEYSFNLSGNPSDFFDADMDSVMNDAVKTDTSYAAQDFTTPYPAYFIAGVQYNMFSRLRFYVNLRQKMATGLNPAASSSRISVATELRPAKWFPIRFGMTTGDINLINWGGGFGFEFSHYSLIFGFSQTGGFLNHATGFSFALGQELRF